MGMRGIKSSDWIGINIQTDYGAVGDGVENDYPAFVACRNAIAPLRKPAHVYWPPGTYFLDTSIAIPFATGAATPPFETPPEIVVSGYGATVLSGDNFHAAGFGFGSTSYRILTTTAGATQVEFVTPAEAAAFAVDINGSPLKYFAVVGLEMQTPSGPPNNYYIEYRRILNVNTTTGIVTFTKPLANIYKSTFPLLNTGAHGIDGPASVFPMDSRWNTNASYRGVTFDNSGHVFTTSRSSSFIDCVFTGYGLCPTGSELVVARGCRLSEFENEVDKEVEAIELYDCTSKAIHFQSASINNVLMEDVDCDDALLGGGRNTVLRRVTSPVFNFGVSSFGILDSLDMEDCVFDDVDLVTVNSLISDFTNTGGVLTRAAGVAIRWALPGAKGFLFTSDSNNTVGIPFTVTDITESGGVVSIHTTLPDPIPTFSGFFTPAKLGIIGGSLTSLSATGCSGCPEMVELSLAAAIGKRLGEYANRTFTEIGMGAYGRINVWGRLISINVNVTRAYTGAQATCLWHPASQYGAQIKDENYADQQWDVIINLKTTGLRTIAPAGVTGLQTGDVLPSINAASWITSIHPYLGTDVSGDTAGQKAIVNLEIILDQSE